MILGLLLLLFLLGLGAAVLARQPMWRELLHGPSEPLSLPPPDFTEQAKLEHELWGNREHSSSVIAAHCWTCHPDGTAESIGALTPEQYMKVRDKLIGGAITNTPFTAAPSTFARQYDEEKAKKDAWIRDRIDEDQQKQNAALIRGISISPLGLVELPEPQHLVQHQHCDHIVQPPSDPGVHHHG